MDWTTAQARLTELRRIHDAGGDVAEDAGALREAVDQLAEGGLVAPGDEIPAGNPEATARKADLIRHHLTVGEIELPAGADATLAEIAREFAPQVIGPAMRADFNRRLEGYLREVREARDRAAALAAGKHLLESRVATFRAYQALLDALLRKRADGEEAP